MSEAIALLFAFFMGRKMLLLCVVCPAGVGIVVLLMLV